MKRTNAIDADALAKSEATQAAMQADVARTRLNLRGVGDLPINRETAAQGDHRRAAGAARLAAEDAALEGGRAVRAVEVLAV